MEITIKGNPGTGNTFMEINIQHVENFNPAATAVTNNYNGTRARQQDAPQIHDVISIEHIRGEILSYVGRLCICLADEWKSSYKKLWESILDMKVISDMIYNPGKQQGTNFNRSLVANIIHYLYGKGIYEGDYNAAHYAELLEGDKDHSVRRSLGMEPEPPIMSRLNHYFEGPKFM